MNGESSFRSLKFKTDLMIYFFKEILFLQLEKKCIDNEEFRLYTQTLELLDL